MKLLDRLRKWVMDKHGLERELGYEDVKAAVVERAVEQANNRTQTAYQGDTMYDVWARAVPRVITRWEAEAMRKEYPELRGIATEGKME